VSRRAPHVAERPEPCDDDEPRLTCPVCGAARSDDDPVLCPVCGEPALAGGWAP
jgi:hypothetical protein